MLRCRVNIFGKKYHIDDAVRFPLYLIGRHIMLVCSIIVDGKFDFFIKRYLLPFISNLWGDFETL